MLVLTAVLGDAGVAEVEWDVRRMVGGSSLREACR